MFCVFVVWKRVLGKTTQPKQLDCVQRAALIDICGATPTMALNAISHVALIDKADSCFAKAAFKLMKAWYMRLLKH